MLAYLACDCHEATSARGIARRIGATEGVARQILVQLANAGWLSGTRGRSGGYTRNQDAATPTLRDILVVFEGPIDQTFCQSQANCNGGVQCPHHNLWENLSQQFEVFLSKLKLDQLASGNYPQMVDILESAPEHLSANRNDIAT